MSMDIRRPRLDFALPGTWWSAPLDADAEARMAAIAEFVRELYGRRDDLARTRAEHRARLSRAIDEAARGGAVQMHVSEANEGGIAFASTLTEYALPAVFGASAEPSVLADRVVGALANVAGDHWSAFAADGGTAFAKGDSIVLRRVTRRGPDGTDTPDAPDTPAGDDAADAHGAAPERGAEAAESLTADYWLTVPGRAEVALVSLSSVLGPLEPLMLELFDRIIAAAEWRAAPSLRDELAGRAG
ncbi:hypothetical protein [Agromyces sp. NPDC058110]|uniref:hypothetical protein n=1 Tax=Agromyces sp. NPDC058110 TaxID=3346345 RepID=UPI0036DF18A4